MNRRFMKTNLAEILFVLLLVLQQSWGQQNINAYDDYDDQENFNDRHPLDRQLHNVLQQHHYQAQNKYDSNGRQMDYLPRAYEGQLDDVEPNHRTYQLYPEEEQTSSETQKPRVYQPRPNEHPTEQEDPNILLVPRLGLVRGQYNFKIIQNRQISAYLGLKYGTVKPGLGRFQVCLQNDGLS